MAQLEARQDLSVLLRVLLFLPYVSRDKLLCSPSVLHCLPALASHQSSSKQDLCTERMKKGFCLLAVVLISAQCGCVLQLRGSTHRGDQCVYMKMQRRQRFSMDGRPRRKTLVACLVVPALLCRRSFRLNVPSFHSI